MRLKSQRNSSALGSNYGCSNTPEPTPVVPEVVAPAPEPEPEAEPVTKTVHGNETEATLSLAAPPEAAPVEQPAPPVEARSARQPFATGRTRQGPKAWRQGGIVSLTDHEWARVKADLTDAEAADGEAGGTRLQALVTRYGADLTWSPARPA